MEYFPLNFNFTQKRKAGWKRNMEEKKINKALPNMFILFDKKKENKCVLAKSPVTLIMFSFFCLLSVILQSLLLKMFYNINFSGSLDIKKFFFYSLANCDHKIKQIKKESREIRTKKQCFIFISKRYLQNIRIIMWVNFYVFSTLFVKCHIIVYSENMLAVLYRLTGKR